MNVAEDDVARYAPARKKILLIIASLHGRHSDGADLEGVWLAWDSKIVPVCSCTFHISLYK